MCRWMLWVMLAINSVTGAVRLQGQELGESEITGGISFDLACDFLVVVEGQAGSLRGLKFIVDTGATRSLIDRKVAARLQLKRHAGRIMNFNRYIPIEWAEVPELRMGPLRAQDIRVMVVNLAEYSEFAKSMDGVIGLDLLTRTEKFTIDYAKKRLYFERLANGTHRPVSGLFVVPIIVQGFAMRLGVDTGLSDILLYRDRLRKRPVKLRTEGEPSPVTIGRLKGKKVTLPGVQIGGPEEAITVVMIDGPSEHALPRLDGYLGVASLDAKRVVFDFAKMSLHWELGARSR
jgi:predicted aspartyl protease